MKKTLLFIVFFAILVRIYFLINYHDLWWDSAVYAGMGKYIFSQGHSGLWEPLRPITLPIILGFFWFLRLDFVLFWKILQLFLSVSTIYLLYLIGIKTFDRRTAILACALMSASFIFVLMSTQLYAEILAVFFLMVSIYYALNHKAALSAIFLSLSILSKFPIIFFFPIFLIFFWEQHKIQSFCKWFLLSMLPFLMLNTLIYHNPIFPFVQAHDVILRVVGCNVLNKQPWYFYFSKTLLENVLFILAPIGIFLSLKKKIHYALPMTLCLLVPLGYFTYLPCRDYRYILVFIPFVAIFSAFALSQLTRKIKYFTVLVIIVLAASSLYTIVIAPKSASPNISIDRYYHFIDNLHPIGEVWSSNPNHALYSDVKINLVYYPVYDNQTSQRFLSILRYDNNISYVLLDTCDGGIICNPVDKVCKDNLQQTISLLRTNYAIAYQYTNGLCLYYVFEKKSI